MPPLHENQYLPMILSCGIGLQTQIWPPVHVKSWSVCTHTLMTMQVSGNVVSRAQSLTEETQIAHNARQAVLYQARYLHIYYFCTYC